MAKYKKIFSKIHTENWLIEKFIIDSVLKTNPWTYKMRYLNVKRIGRSFYKKELLRVKL